MRSVVSRRRFLQASTAAAFGASIIPEKLAFSYAANQRLGVAIIGAGGRGSWFVETIPRIGENVVALCDTNERRAAASFEKMPDVPKFNDFRKMLAELDRQIDAVVVATPDHTHAVATAAAIRAGKHVYCEKPLTRDVHEARIVRQLARQHGVATQMGNQGTATHAFRRAVELIRAGSIGAIQEVHVWGSGGGQARQLPSGSEPVPPGLEWDLWLGPAAYRPFHPQWLQWHAWRDFGTGRLGNWGPHSANLPFIALQVDSLWHAALENEPRPTIRLDVQVSAVEPHGFPSWEAIDFRIPARADLPPVTIHWSNGWPEGRQRIEQHLGRRLDWGDAGDKKWLDHGGALIVGSEGMIRATEHNSSFELLPAEKFADFEGPAPSLPRSGSHEREWIAACKGGPSPMSDFDYAGPLNEMLMLGNVATRLGRAIEFEPVAMICPGDEEAVELLTNRMRDGWSL